jgi:hypothetical protein
MIINKIEKNIYWNINILCDIPAIEHHGMFIEGFVRLLDEIYCRIIIRPFRRSCLAVRIVEGFLIGSIRRRLLIFALDIGFYRCTIFFFLRWIVVVILVV